MNTAVSLIRLPTAADVEDAARVLAGVAVRTPLLSSAVLDQITGGRVFLKAEVLQRENPGWTPKQLEERAVVNTFMRSEAPGTGS